MAKEVAPDRSALEHDEEVSKLVKPHAPKWFKEGVAEYKILGISPREALERMKRSAFVQQDWFNAEHGN
jgi:hypothetical protein